MRRHNHIAKDLRTPKYAPRVVPKKSKNEKWNPMDWLDHLDGRDDK